MAGPQWKYLERKNKIKVWADELVVAIILGGACISCVAFALSFF